MMEKEKMLTKKRNKPKIKFRDQIRNQPEKGEIEACL